MNMYPKKMQLVSLTIYLDNSMTIFLIDI